MPSFEDRKKKDALEYAVDAAYDIDQVPLEEFGALDGQSMQEKAFARMIASDTVYQLRMGSKLERSFDASKASRLYPRAVKVLEGLGYIAVDPSPSPDEL